MCICQKQHLGTGRGGGNQKMSFDEMQNMQKELHQKYLEKWGPLSPKLGRELLLWMIGEAGEVADIIKKRGDALILEDETTRHDFVEEMSDVLMYFNDVMLCYGVTPEELAETYQKKHDKNMSRW